MTSGGHPARAPVVLRGNLLIRSAYLVVGLPYARSESWLPACAWRC
jgi:hypothetical protein